MDQRAIKELLERVAQGSLPVDEALLRLKAEPFEDLGFAKLDHHRGLRQGVAEVIYGAGKTPEQIREIAAAMRARGQKTILITRLSAEAAAVSYTHLDVYKRQLPHHARKQRKPRLLLPKRGL